MKVEVRSAREEDVPVIHSFIKQIAEQEGLLERVTSSPTDIHKSLFGSDAVAKCFLAFCENQPAGCLVYCPKFSSYNGRNEIYIEDLAVNPDIRGQGIGQKLMVHLAKIAREQGVSRLELFVHKDNEQALKFYKKIGAKIKNYIHVMQVEGEDLTSLSQRSK